MSNHASSALAPTQDQAQNERGEWVPMPPEPLFVGLRLRKARCSCGETFRDRREYRGHYAIAHILGLS